MTNWEELKQRYDVTATEKLIWLERNQCEYYLGAEKLAVLLGLALRTVKYAKAHMKDLGLWDESKPKVPSRGPNSRRIGA